MACCFFAQTHTVYGTSSLLLNPRAWWCKCLKQGLRAVLTTCWESIYPKYDLLAWFPSLSSVRQRTAFTQQPYKIYAAETGGTCDARRRGKCRVILFARLKRADLWWKYNYQYKKSGNWEIIRNKRFKPYKRQYTLIQRLQNLNFWNSDICYRFILQTTTNGICFSRRYLV